MKVMENVPFEEHYCGVTCLFTSSHHQSHSCSFITAEGRPETRLLAVKPGGTFQTKPLCQNI